MNDRLRQITVVVLSIAQLITNAIGGAGINGQSVGTVSDNFVTAFIPAGITFAVWGPIYLGLTAYAIYQSLPRQHDRQIHRQIGWLAALAAAGNAAWTPLWVTGNVTISLLVMFVILGSLAAIFVQLRNLRGTLTTADRWAVMIPFSGYFAWITVATVANVTTTLITWGWDGFGIADPVWSVIAIAAAVLITTLMIIFSRGHAGIFAYTGVLIWAFVGVYLGNAEQYMIVGVVALSAAAIVTIATALRFWRQPEAMSAPRRTATA
jgi:benzodiazapine receptor